MRTVLTLVRHGETSANLDGVWHGSTDTPLTERGRRQAERVAGFLAQRHRDATALYSSPLARARDTAGVISAQLGLPLVIDPGLAEYHLGSWEGLSYADLHNKHRLWERIKEDADFAPHGGESPRTVVDRFTGSLRRIAAQHGGERVVVVAHGGALSMVLADAARRRLLAVEARDEQLRRQRARDRARAGAALVQRDRASRGNLIAAEGGACAAGHRYTEA